MVSIIVKNNFEALHRWKDAPDDVRFLRYLHRHMFYVESKIEVFHNDRELEFILVKHFIDDCIKQLLSDNYDYNISCENIAEYIINCLSSKYGKRTICVTVFEDNENGAIVETSKE